MDDLTAEADRLLIASLPESLTSLITALAEQGYSRLFITTRLRRRGVGRDTLNGLACEALLDQLFTSKGEEQ